MMQVFFVDDEKNILDGLRRGMHGMRSEWNMTFATSGTEALALMQEFAPDVVVSDMRMPGMNGRDLLLEVKRLYPQAVRFVLSGYAEPSSVMQVAGTAHQYLSKPCESAVLKAALTRSLSLRTLLQDPVLLRRVGRIDALPSLPSVYQEIVYCLRAPDPELKDIARIVDRDVVMTTMVLKLANSAFFGARQSFRSADRAVAFLGLNNIAGLVLAHSIFNEFEVSQTSGLNLAQLWDHSLRTATCARTLARAEKWTTERTEEAFLAGVLHDLGKLVLATRPAPEAGPMDREDSHAAAGAYLLGLWGFSDGIIEAIAYHHAPAKANGAGFGLAGLIHVADWLAHRAVGTHSPDDPDIDMGYLESLNLAGRLPEWQAAETLQ